MSKTSSKLNEKMAPFTVDMNVYVRPGPDIVNMVIAPAPGVALPTGAVAEVKVVVRRTGKVVRRRRLTRLEKPGWEQVSWPTTRMPFDCCEVAVDLRDQQGRCYPTRILQCQDFQELSAARRRSSAGRTPDVLPPYEPVQHQAQRGRWRLSCWGRSYEGGGAALLRRIASGGAQMLAGPVRLVAQAANKPLRWRTVGEDVAEEARDHVSIWQKRRAGALQLDTLLRLEVDGMLRCDARLQTDKSLTLQSLILEVPLKPQLARYLYVFPGLWGSARNAGALPADGWTSDFMPFVWLGDEQRGLAWFAESDRDWQNDSDVKPVRITREEDAVVLRLHLVTRPVTLIPETSAWQAAWGDLPAERQPIRSLSYTFGIQATPIKPVTVDAWDTRTVCLSQGKERWAGRLSLHKGLLKEWAAQGVRSVVVFEHWTDAEADFRTTHGKDLKAIVEEAHSLGMAVLPYFSFLISDLAPEWPRLGEHCLVLPRSGYPLHSYPPQPLQSAWKVCYRSEWQDFLVEGIARAMDEYDFDGVYLDGTGYPWPCANTLHGCGHVRPDGAVKPTYPIFAVREIMRRIYAVVKERKPDGIVNYHNSTCMVTPSLAWTTTCWDGEQFQGHGQGPFALEALPLDAFRCEFMGKQWGIAAEFLLAGELYTYDTVQGIALLHDVPVRPFTAEQIVSASRLWRILDDFGRTAAKWLPYWANERFVTASPDTLVSLYQHETNGILAVIMNVTPRQRPVRVVFDGDALGIQQPKARDAFSGESVALRGGVVSLTLPSLDWRLLWLTRGKP